MNTIEFWTHVDTPWHGCWEWQGGTHNGGYGSLRFNGQPKDAHRVAYEIIVGPIPDGLCVLHTCDNPPCVRLSHLFLGTKGENNHDRAAKGRSGADIVANMTRHPQRRARGERQGSAKLTQTQVYEIRLLYSAGRWTHRQLAHQFAVSKTCIGEITRGENWRPNDWPEVEKVLKR